MGRRGRRAGRKRDPNAKRRGPRRSDRDLGTDELRAKRARLTFGAEVGLEFPLDVLLARGTIDTDQRDEGLRYTHLHWWRYGWPHAGCEALYDRMCSGVIGDEFSPRAEGESDDPEEHKRRLARVTANKERMERMEAALSERQLEALKRVGPFLQLPRAVLVLADGGEPEARDRQELADIKEALRALVQVRDAEDRNYRRRKRAR